MTIDGVLRLATMAAAASGKAGQYRQDDGQDDGGRAVRISGRCIRDRGGWLCGRGAVALCNPPHRRRWCSACCRRWLAGLLCCPDGRCARNLALPPKGIAVRCPHLGCCWKRQCASSLRTRAPCCWRRSSPVWLPETAVANDEHERRSVAPATSPRFKRRTSPISPNQRKRCRCRRTFEPYFCSAYSSC